MIDVMFFAQVRELVAMDKLTVEPIYPNVESLRQALCQRGDKWQLALDAENILMAVNQSLVTGEQTLNDGDEVAFFPPVTGG